ncbi:uncharacterized protein PV07_08513 [Cladophialophora immunda]|uniref:Uncharacterized protein n=1 Tax=Cladophialophora immunda TaxID=569365 RepID=A0A0D1ZC43_9EURO|nr:uncharacterized protein PV07_08513 [Cladophialophora immunda]KIW25326.1 hypothetical protein PV07_08513 [Cladophialophora immunda]OQV03303.1 hypothetical protein CLAIMM_08356 [Cladophialophora immunda]
MPTPAQPILPSFSNAAPSATPDPSDTLEAMNHDGRHSPGAIVGITICVLVCLAWIVRYSYLASPFWLHRLQRCLGIRPSSRTPISHVPLPLDETETEPPTPFITRPEPAYIPTSSKDTLPLNEPTIQFSRDVLEALFNLGPAAGATRPPSYRSKLSQEWRSAMGTRARNRGDEESGRASGRGA